MSLFSNSDWFIKFLAPVDTPAGGGAPAGDASMGVEDTIEFLGEETDDKEVINLEDSSDKRTPPKDGKDESGIDKKTGKEAQEGDETTEEVDELAELEEELKGPTDEQLELVTPVRRKEILAKYPNLFKDFPYLEKAYYREQQYTDLLPTIDDAKAAVESAQILRMFENDIAQGNITTVLQATRNEHPDDFAKLVDNYLPALQKVDPQAHLHVVGNIVKHTIATMVMEGKRSNNDALISAAQVLNQFTFGTSEYTGPRPLSKQNGKATQEQTQLQQERQEFNQRQLDTAVEDVNTKFNNTLKNTVEGHIDPKGSMTKYVKEKAIEDCLSNLESLISKDTRFRSLADKLWEQAIQSGFKKEAVDKVRSAFLTKAKTLLPTVIKEARKKALQGMGKTVRDDDDSTPTSNKRGPVTQTGTPRSNSSGRITKASDIPKGMRTLDFLNTD